jgi:hypothetical protein
MSKVRKPNIKHTPVHQASIPINKKNIKYYAGRFFDLENLTWKEVKKALQKSVFGIAALLCLAYAWYLQTYSLVEIQSRITKANEIRARSINAMNGIFSAQLATTVIDSLEKTTKFNRYNASIDEGAAYVSGVLICQLSFIDSASKFEGTFIHGQEIKKLIAFSERTDTIVAQIELVNYVTSIEKMYGANYGSSGEYLSQYIKARENDLDQTTNRFLMFYIIGVTLLSLDKALSYIRNERALAKD